VADYATPNGQEGIIYIQKQFKEAPPSSLSYFKDKIYFWEISNVEKCSRKLKMDKKNVQFSKTQGLYGKQVFKNGICTIMMLIAKKITLILLA